MKARNIILLSSTVMIAAMLLIMAQTSPPTAPPPIFWGKVTVDALPAFDAMVRAYVELSPGNYEYRAQTKAVENKGEAWYSFDVPGDIIDEGRTIVFNVTPSGSSDSYQGGTGTYKSGDSTLLHLYANTAPPASECEIGSSCDECTGWVSPDTSHDPCNSPYYGCVRKNGGLYYDWACCGGTIDEILIF